MKFDSQVKRAVFNLENDTEDTIRKTLLNIFGDTIRGTPVDTGRLRNNWYTTKSTPSTKTSKGGTSDSPTASTRAISQAVALTQRIKIGDLVFFTNNLPYAYITEYGGIVNGKYRAGNYMLTTAVKNAGKKR